MKMNKEELNRFKVHVIYNEGYRVVYYYEKYHEVPQSMYAKNIEDFTNLFKENGKTIKYTGVNDLLLKFLEKNPKALGVAVYDINQNCIAKMIKNGVKKVNDSIVYKEELIYDKNYITVDSGYRIVYLYKDGSYKVGMYANKLEEFMKEFASYEPIDDDCEIPPFVSIDDLLNRYLDVCSNIDGVALYNVDGTLIKQKEKSYNLK